MLLAELDHSAAAFAGELCFEAARLVVNPGMNDAAIAASLMEGELGLLFEQKDREARLTAAQTHCGGKADKPATNTVANARFNSHLNQHQKLSPSKPHFCNGNHST